MFFPFGKNVKKIAAPEPHAFSQPVTVPGNPMLTAPHPLACQQQRWRRFANRLNYGRFIMPLKRSGETAYNAEAGKSFTEIFFDF
jgi:hypothetical protein